MSRFISNIRMLSIFVVATITSLSATLIADVPSVKVPFASKHVRLDGQFDYNEWSDAAIVRRIVGIGKTEIAEPETMFYLKYDSVNLWVCAVCDENNSAYPKAYPRSPLDLLTDDDAVQVLIGVGEDTQNKKMEFGGYADAQGTETPPLAHFYEFTVNAVGAVSRTYNESPLKEPLFEARTGIIKKEGWVAEFCIPLKSAGISDSNSGELFYLNLFRFRPPQRLGWYIPGWGNYVPMPVGTMTLLNKSENDKRTIETLPEPLRVSDDKTKSEIKQKEKLKANIEFYSLSRKLIATLDTSNLKEQVVATLYVEGLSERVVEKLKLNKKNSISLILPDLPPSTHKAILEIKDGNDKQLAVFSQEIQFYVKPEWFGTNAGIPYLKDRVPSPWKVPLIENDTVVLAHCRITFGPAGLPKSVLDEQGELLAAPGTIDLSYNNKSCKVIPETLNLKPQDNSVLIIASQRFPGGVVETRTLLDYDGFMEVKFRIRECDPKKISHLKIQIPLRKEQAFFVNRGSVQDTRKLSDYGYEGEEGEIWLGSYEKGLSFSKDTPLFLAQNSRSAIQVVPSGQSASLFINLVDRAGQLNESDHIFRFFLQPTPTKKNMLGLKKMNESYFRWFESWSDYQAYPDLAKLPAVKAKSDEMHKQGKLLVLYFGQVLAENSPGFKEYKNELIAPPERPWYKRAYDPGKDVPCYVCCVKGPRGDQVLYGVEKLMKEGNIDGIYMDGLSVDWDCQNQSHPGCGDNASIEWDNPFPSRIIGTRAFLKRLRGIFDERGKPYLLETHTGGGLNVNTSSLCDMALEGEQLHRYRLGYRMPLYKFAVGYSGWPWGRTNKMLAMIYDLNGSSYQAMTWTLLHDVEIEPHSHPEPIEKVIYGDFQDEKTVYYPYWHKQPHVKLLKGNEVYFSYYRNDNAAMLIASNLNYDDQEVGLDLEGLFGQPIQVIDVERNAVVPVVKGKVNITVNAWMWKALRIEPFEDGNMPEKTSEKQVIDSNNTISEKFKVGKFIPQDWKLSGNGSSSLLGKEAAPKSGGLPVYVESQPYMEYAKYSYEKYSFDNDCTIKLRLKHGNAIEIGIGPYVLGYGSLPNLPWASPWSVNGTDNTDIKGKIYSRPIVTDRDVVLEINISNRKLNALYDGKPLVRNLKLKSFDTTGNKLVISTWGGNSFAFDIIELANNPTDLFKKDIVDHPVR